MMEEFSERIRNDIVLYTRHPGYRRQSSKTIPRKE
jgi:hypothetical protein